MAQARKIEYTRSQKILQLLHKHFRFNGWTLKGDEVSVVTSQRTGLGFYLSIKESEKAIEIDVGLPSRKRVGSGALRHDIAKGYYTALASLPDEMRSQIHEIDGYEVLKLSYQIDQHDEQIANRVVEKVIDLARSLSETDFTSCSAL